MCSSRVKTGAIKPCGEALPQWVGKQRRQCCRMSRLLYVGPLPAATGRLQLEYVLGLQALGTFHQFELYRLALVEGAVAVSLD